MNTASKNKTSRRLFVSTSQNSIRYASDMPSKRRPTKASLVERKRAGNWQVRKTVYFLPPTIERLERYAFHHRLSLWEVVDAAAVEYLDRVAPVQTRRRGPANAPPQSTPLAPPSTPAPRSKRRTPAPPAQNPPQAAPPSVPTPPRSRRRSSTVPSPVNDSQAPPPSVPPSTRKTSAPPKSRRT